MKKLLLLLVFLLCLPLCAFALEGDMGMSILSLPGLVESPYDAYPALGIYTAIDAEQDADGNYEATIRVTNRCFGEPAGSNFPAAKDVEIEVIAMDGLQILSGVGSFYFKEIPYGETAAVQVSVRYVPEDESPTEKPDPRLLVYVDSANLGSAKYTAHFEATGDATAYLLGWDCNTGTPDAIQNDLSMMESIFSRCYYNGQPVQIVSEYEYPDFWEIFSQFVECPQNDSDITYLYINAHGAQTGGFVPDYLPAFFAYTPGADPVEIFGLTYENQNIVTYLNLLAYPNYMRGRVVLLFDNCFSGYAISRADMQELDTARHSILTAVDDGNTAGAYDNPIAAYGWFTHDLHEYAGKTTQQTITAGEAYEYLNVNKIWTPKGSLLPQLYGNADNPLFCFNPYYWEMGCSLKVTEETLEIKPPAFAYFDFIEQVLIPEIGCAPTEEIFGPSAFSAEHWASLSQRVHGLLSSVVCDLDQNGTMDLLTVSIPQRSADEIHSSDVHFSVDLTLYQLDNGVVTRTDERIGALRMGDGFADGYGHFVVQLSEHADETLLHAWSYYDNRAGSEGGDTLLLTIKDGKFVASDFRPWDLDYFTEDGTPYKLPSATYGTYYQENLNIRQQNAGDHIAFINYDCYDYKYIAGADRPQYVYRADDYTSLHSDERYQAHDLLTLTSKPKATPLPAKSAEEAHKEAVRDSIKTALGNELLSEMEAKGYTWYASFKKGELSQLQFNSPSDQLYDDVDHDLMRRIYLAALRADAFGLSDANIEALSGFEFSYNNQHSYPQMFVDYTEKPFGGVALLLTPEH